MPLKYADFEPDQRFRFNARDAGHSDCDISEMVYDVKMLIQNGVSDKEARTIVMMAYANTKGEEQPRYRSL